jgi:glycine dehydrogenase subunit 1
MATVFMTVYGKQGLRELAEQNLAKAHYLASRLPLRFSGPFFNEFVSVAESPEALNEALLERKIVGGLPIECWYPELPNGVLLCATEMNRRQDMDTLAEVFAQTRELNRVAAR